MAHEYLQSKKLDKRFQIAADFLKCKTENQIIVDLNCGSSRILDYIEDDYWLYMGNDIDKTLLRPNTKKTVFLHNKDDEIVSIVKVYPFPVDILLVFGMGAGDVHESPYESPTLQKSVLEILECAQPKYLLLETALKWENRFTPISRIRDKIKGYNVVMVQEIIVDNDLEDLSNRFIMIMERVG